MVKWLDYHYDMTRNVLIIVITATCATIAAISGSHTEITDHHLLVGMLEYYHGYWVIGSGHVGHKHIRVLTKRL